MGQRLDLHEILVEVLGSRNVYFQPPPNLQMKYPAIRYERDYAVSQHGDGHPYVYTKRYLVTYIDRDPDSPIPDRLARIPSSKFSRHYVADGLNHDAFNIFY